MVMVAKNGRVGEVTSRGAWAARWAVSACAAGFLISAGCTDLFGFQGASEVQCVSDSDCPENLMCVASTCARADSGSNRGTNSATVVDAVSEAGPEEEGPSDAKPSDGPSDAKSSDGQSDAKSSDGPSESADAKDVVIPTIPDA